MQESTLFLFFCFSPIWQTQTHQGQHGPCEYANANAWRFRALLGSGAWEFWKASASCCLSLAARGHYDKNKNKRKLTPCRLGSLLLKTTAENTFTTDAVFVCYCCHGNYLIRSVWPFSGLMFTTSSSAYECTLSLFPRGCAFVASWAKYCHLRMCMHHVSTRWYYREVLKNYCNRMLLEIWALTNCLNKRVNHI